MFLDKAREIVDKSKDTVIVQKVVTDISGGVVLDVEDYKGKYIYAGQPIVVEDKDGRANYKPLNVTKDPVEDEKGTLAAVGEGEEVIGFAIQTENVDHANVGVVTFGVINNEAAYFDVAEHIEALNFKQPIK